MSDLSDRRARKKARTRAQIRGVAHGLFADRGYDAVTIADVARKADVAVQTVFNHFATKEELFFDGRVPWVDGPADAVRARGTEAPLSALRAYLTTVVAGLVGSMAIEERRCYVATVEAAETLRVHERELVFESERRLAAALTEAWSDDTEPGSGAAPADPALAAALISAVWLSAARTLVVEQRRRISAGACPEELATRAGLITATVLTAFESDPALTAVAGSRFRPADTGRPQAARATG